MSQTHHATYPLAHNGTVQHWLACGTVTTPLDNLEALIQREGSPFGDDGRWVLNYWAWDERSKRMKKRVYEQLPPFTWQPGEYPELHASGIGGKRWEYAVAEEDQVVDFSLFNFTPTLMQGWLFALLQVEQPTLAQAELITIGPARIFLNGTLHTHYHEAFSYVANQRIPVELPLQQGMNAIYLHGEMLGWREARLALGLRFVQPTALTTHIPLGDVRAEQWHEAEDGLNHLQVRQFAFPTLPAHLWLDEAASQPFHVEIEATVPLPTNVSNSSIAFTIPKSIAQVTLAPDERGELPIGSDVTAGPSGLLSEHTLLLKFRPADGTPLEMRCEVWAGEDTFSSTPYGDYDSRRQEAIAHLAHIPYDIPAATAALALGTIRQVPSEAVAIACHFLEHRYDCADFYAIGLLSLLYRYRGQPVLRPADLERVEAAFRGFKFWLDEPGLDAMCYFTENHQVLFHVAAYLAGQLWPDWTFTNSGRTGEQQRGRAQPRIEAWIRTRLQGNFSEWDSNAYMALDAFAMLALVEYADDEHLQAMATTLLDKLFFLLACQSHKGVHGSTHGRCYVAGLKSARVENTSSLGRIAWGMGMFNGETRATSLLALAQRYRVPSLIQQIGGDSQTVTTTRARSRAQFKAEYDMRDDWWDVRTLTYRSPEVMLSAALDYLPGDFGIQEHLWQATLSAEAVVFTTYPGNNQEHGNARPNFWAGSARLPRVGMVDKTVICLYRFEPNVGLGFSHAYFPTEVFDEYVLEGQWAFARYGDGYVALWGDGDLLLTKQGRHAGQELRSARRGEVWICQVGRAADDGEFTTFCSRVKTNAPQVAGLNVQWQTPQGKTLAFGWEGALVIDGQPENWDDFPHYENVYTNTPMNSETMTIAYGGETLTLKLGGKG